MSFLVYYANSDDSDDDDDNDDSCTTDAIQKYKSKTKISDSNSIAINNNNDSFSDISKASLELSSNIAPNSNLNSNFNDDIKDSDLNNDDISDSDSENYDDDCVNNKNEVQQDNSLLDIFSKLPAPIDDDDRNIVEPELIILPSKSEIEAREKPPEKKKIFINFPTIENSDSESDNETGPNAKRIKKLGKCDLFNLLPAPKSSSTKEANRLFVPHSIISNKQKFCKISTQIPPNSLEPLKNPGISHINKSKNTKPENPVKLVNSIPLSTKMISDYYSDSENDESCGNFFSIDDMTNSNLLPDFVGPNLDLCENTNLSNSIGPLNTTRLKSDKTNDLSLNNFSKNISNDSRTYNSKNNSKLFGVDNGLTDYMDKDVNDEPSSDSYIYPLDIYVSGSHTYPSDINVSESNPNIMIGPSLNASTNSAQKKNSGAPRDFADFESAELVEARIDDWMSGYQLQQVKDLTKEENRVSFSKKHNKDMPTSQQKRKHQITFLAYEAKERELELKNQWAENRYSKKQTQSKYGF